MSQYNFNQKFLDPEKVLFKTGLRMGQTAADLGAGAGFYALAAGKVVGPSGKIFVVDILETSLAHVSADARLRMLKNITTLRADLDEPNSLAKMEDGTCDLVILGNLLHQIKNRTNVLKETYRIMKTGGKVLVVDWNDTPGPIGPRHEERLPEEQVVKLMHTSGFKPGANVDTDNYHYGLIFTK